MKLTDLFERGMPIPHTAKPMGLKKVTKNGKTYYVPINADPRRGEGNQVIVKDNIGPAPSSVCKSSKPNSELPASWVASCKSKGLRSREGGKSHKIGKSKSSRVKVGGKKIKGKNYGGPLPDYS